MWRRSGPGVLGKFLIAFVPIFLLFVTGGLCLFANNQIDAKSGHLAARIGAQLGRVSSHLTLDLARDKPEDAARTLSMLMTDQAITCVDVHFGAKFAPELSHPKNLGCKVMTPERELAVAVPHAEELQLKVGYSEAEIRVLKDETVQLSLIIALASILVSLIVGVLAFGYSVKKPLGRLLSSIRDMESGIFRHAEVRSGDEIGRLCVAFNSMQDSIELQKARTEQALNNLRSVYDSAPAFLFTIRADGVIQSASKHCLQRLGFSSGKFVGKPLKEFLGEQSKSVFEERVLAKLAGSVELKDIPLQLNCNNSDVSETLLSVVPDRRLTEGSKVYVCVLKDVTELREKEADLRRQSLTDSLTGLPNRRGISHILEIIHERGEDSRNWAVLFIDLDNFKTANDTFGHEAGDEILIETSKRIRDVVGDSGYTARMGGDEFTVILDDMGSTEFAEELGRQLVDAIRKPVHLSRGIGHVGASIGIAFCSDAAMSPGEAIKLADQAMYLAKSGGKNRIAIYDHDIADAITKRAQLIQNISAGIPKNWFAVHLQPIIDLTAMRPYAFEALLRVREDMGYEGSIEELIRAAEETGQMEALGTWIFDEAIGQFRKLVVETGAQDFKISINLSPCQLTPRFVDYAIEQAKAHPEIAGRVVLEITETAALADYETARIHLQRLRDHEYRIAVDDFGTGYSSLSLISRMPIDVLKLDQSFAGDLQHAASCPGRSDGPTALVRCIVMLARELGIELIAEGLENSTVVSRFRDLGVVLGQGYIFSRPIPNEQIPEWMACFEEGREEPVRERRALAS